MMRIVGGLLLCVVLGALAWLAAESTEGFEHWLNRYQTLLGAFIALAAAFIAAYPAWRQLRATIGDRDPEFWLDWSHNIGGSYGDVEDALLGIVNLNRRTLALKKVVILRPTGTSLGVAEARDLVNGEGRWQGHRPIPRATGTDWRNWEGEYNVPGQQERYLVLELDIERDTAKVHADEEVRVRVEYVLRGEEKLRRVDIDGAVPRNRFQGHRKQHDKE
ncbi:hypothetical protein ASF65_20430 [Aureimonas sp. Leaf324]|nr:hypothetical protein ASF65_20430 [Aureimonas sp. Leaf324]